MHLLSIFYFNKLTKIGNEFFKSLYMLEKNGAFRPDNNKNEGARAKIYEKINESEIEVYVLSSQGFFHSLFPRFFHMFFINFMMRKLIVARF